MYKTGRGRFPVKEDSCIRHRMGLAKRVVSSCPRHLTLLRVFTVSLFATVWTGGEHEKTTQEMARFGECAHFLEFNVLSVTHEMEFDDILFMY